METVVHGSSPSSPSFQKALHGALRTLIDKLDVSSFNVGILGMNAVRRDLAAAFVEDNSKPSPDAGSEATPGVIAR